MDSLRGLQLVQLIRYGSMFATGIVFVQVHLPKDTIGSFESLIFLASAVSFFWIAGIIQSLLPLYRPEAAEDNDQQGSRSLFFNSFLLLLTFSGLAAGFIMLLGSWLADFLDTELGSDMIYYIAAFVFLQGPSSMVEYIFLLKKKTRSMISYGWISFGIQFLAVSVTAFIGLDLQWILLALIGSSLIRFIWLLLVLKKYSEFKVSKKFIGEHLSLGYPIIISVLLSGSAQYVDGLIITANYDSEVFAIFRYGARELPLVALLAHALSSAMVPEIAQKGPVKGLRILKNKASSLGSWLFPVSLILLLTSHILFPVVYDRGFSESATIFNIYLLVIITRLVFPQTILIAFKKTRFLMVASALELTMNIGLSLYFVQIWGIFGVAYATLIAYVFERVVLIVYSKVILGLRLRDYLNINKHLIWSFILVMAFVFVELYLGEVLINLFS